MEHVAHTFLTRKCPRNDIKMHPISLRYEAATTWVAELDGSYLPMVWRSSYHGLAYDSFSKNNGKAYCPSAGMAES